MKVKRWIKDWKLYCKDNELSCKFDADNGDHITWVHDGEYEDEDLGIFVDDIIEDLTKKFGNLKEGSMRGKFKRESFSVNVDRTHKDYIDNFYDSSKIVNDDEKAVEKDDEKAEIKENYKKFFKEDFSYLDKASEFLRSLRHWLFQGKDDDALRDFIEALMQVSAPGPIKRMIVKEYGVEDTSSSSVEDSAWFVYETLEDMHGGKSDDAFNSFIRLLLNRASPKSVVNFATKWALNKGETSADKAEIQANVDKLKRRAKLIVGTEV